MIPYGWNFANVYDISTLRMGSFLHKIPWTDEECFTCDGVFNVQNSHFWARDNLNPPRTYQVCFSVSVWAAIFGDIAVGPYLLPDRLTAQRYRDFLETFLPGLLEDVPLEEPGGG
jgi:hypothetical protein